MGDGAKTGITVDRIAGRIGAVLSGVRLSGDLDEDAVAAIRNAVLKHKVIFFRGQGHLDDETHVAFTSLLGEPVGHPSTARKGNPIPVGEVDSTKGVRADAWHTDISFVVDPQAFSLLRAVELPPYGGETTWANTVAAYENLPGSLQRLANELWVLHSNEHGYERRADLDDSISAGNEKFSREVFSATIFETKHPVVRIHPETGEPSFLLGNFAKRIVGTSGSDSTLLIELFQNHITQLENTVRWHWAQGDLAIWDNRATQHYALFDYGDMTRRLRRYAVDGDIPVGVDGRSSVIVKGEDAGWYRDSPLLARS